MLSTPDLAHLGKTDYECVYEPAEDTFLLLDALESELPQLLAVKPSIGLEICSGSGCVITFLARSLYPHPLVCLATELNPVAVLATQKTAERNLVSADVLMTSLSDGLARERKLFDVIVCNPPYVPTENLPSWCLLPCKESINCCNQKEMMEGAWAGGIDGRHWIDQLLPRINGLLSSRGLFYLVLHQANKPHQVMEWAKSNWQLDSKIIMQRRMGTELLSAVKFWHAL